VQSTDVKRTLQSGYAELMGIYPPGVSKGPTMTDGEQLSVNLGRGLPRMHIRDANEINAELGNDTLPNGFVSIPIYTFKDRTTTDDVSYGGCPYVVDTV